MAGTAGQGISSLEVQFNPGKGVDQRPALTDLISLIEEDPLREPRRRENPSPNEYLSQGTDILFPKLCHQLEL